MFPKYLIEYQNVKIEKSREKSTKNNHESNVFLKRKTNTVEKILFITSFTVLTFQLCKIPFSMKLQLLADPLLIKTKSKLLKLFLYGNPTYSANDNKLFLDATLKYNLETSRFDGPIF